MTDIAPATRTTTRAAVVRRFGGPENVRLEEVPMPVVGDGEVLVRVRAFGASIGDHRIRARDPPRGFGLVGGFMIGMFRPRHRVLGDSAAERWRRWGSGVTDWSAGDEVVVQTGMNRLGCHAGYVVAKATAVARKPASLSFEDAAALLFGGYTALSLLDRRPWARGPACSSTAPPAPSDRSWCSFAAHAERTVTRGLQRDRAELACSWRRAGHRLHPRGPRDGRRAERRHRLRGQRPR